MRPTEDRGAAHRGRSHYPGRVIPRFSFHHVAIVAAVLAYAGENVGAVTEPPPEPVHLGLYEWMATAPIVMAADVVADDGKFVQAIASRERPRSI